MLYIALQISIAIRYADYAKHRDGAAATVIIKMTVPNSLIEGLKPDIMYFSDTCKELVYTSQRKEKL